MSRECRRAARASRGSGRSGAAPCAARAALSCAITPAVAGEAPPAEGAAAATSTAVVRTMPRRAPGLVMLRSSGRTPRSRHVRTITHAAFVVVGRHDARDRDAHEQRRMEHDMIETAPLSLLARLVGPGPADLYDAWLFAAADATLALADWRSASSGE